MSERLGTNFALLGDEIYLRAGRPIPARTHYGSYPQIEDGVGMVRAFSMEFSKHLSKLKRSGINQVDKRSGTILTGTLFAPVLGKQIEKLNQQFGAALSVEAVENGYFGGDVSVAGLLTGRDLLSARDRISGEYIVIPKQMLKSDEAIMLDGMNIDQVAHSLGQPVHAINLQELATLLLNKN